MWGPAFGRMYVLALNCALKPRLQSGAGSAGFLGHVGLGHLALWLFGGAAAVCLVWPALGKCPMQKSRAKSVTKNPVQKLVALQSLLVGNQVPLISHVARCVLARYILARYALARYTTPSWNQMMSESLQRHAGPSILYRSTSWLEALLRIARWIR